jgi:hypothetical protein
MCIKVGYKEINPLCLARRGLYLNFVNIATGLLLAYSKVDYFFG